MPKETTPTKREVKQMHMKKTLEDEDHESTQMMNG